MDINQAAKIMGKKGGNKNKKKGKGYFQNLQRLSSQAKRNKILESFKVEDLDNSVTAKSLTEKLEQIDENK